MGVGQNTGQPRTYVKKTVALLLVRRNLAEWVISNAVLRMRRELNPIRACDALPAKPPYIPWGLEPSIDSRIGVIVQAPVLANQVRFRAIAAQR